MRWSDIPRKPESSTLRWFAAIWLAWFFSLACVAWLGQGDVIAASVLLGVGIVAGLPGLVHPQVIRSVFLGAMMVTFPLGWVVSHVMFALVFYCLFLPVGILFRLTGRDALGRRLDRSRGSYWSTKPRSCEPRSYFRQS